jgi:His-Xaa-Ser system radical SAM maturase HxsC
MLPLQGVPLQVRGFKETSPSHLLRLRLPEDEPSNSADVALVRSSEEAQIALGSKFDSAVIVADDARGFVAQEDLFSRALTLPSQFGYLAGGDILSLRPTHKRVRTLFRRRSKHNAFLVTERCNHYCLMCSQPPRNVDDGWLFDEIRSCLALIDKETQSLGFTGGEPLLDCRRFLQVLGDCRDLLPATAIHVLSNGRAFVYSEGVAAWTDLRHPNLTVGIPIYSAIDHVHDYVVQALGAFDETVLGILKLKDRGQRVEVRVVLHAVTAPRIVETCQWLARNLPFVDHVALMGLEETGFAIANADLLWIDPVDYHEQLAEAVHILASARLHVSVYNLPLCVLARTVWPFAIQSISDWKNDYAKECEPCVEKTRCSGFFTTGRPRRSRGIAAIH